MGSGQSKVDITVDEMIATLKRSSLPTLVTEGGDDVIVFRGAEVDFSSVGLSILPVGGRDKLLQIFCRRDELEHITIAFIADRDVWVYDKVPPEFVSENLVLTDGYSVENDLYRDGNLENLLTNDEVGRFRAELSAFIKWYALAVARVLDGRGGKIRVHPNHLLDNNERLKDELKLQEGEAYPDDLKSKIDSDYKKYLRGKSLMPLIMRQLSYPGRSVRHNHRSIMEIVACNRGLLIGAIYDQLKAIFLPKSSAKSEPT